MNKALSCAVAALSAEKVVVHVEGMLTFSQIRPLALRLNQLIKDGQIREIEVDCQAVSHIDHGGITLLKVLQERGRQHGKKLKIIRSSRVVRMFGFFAACAGRA